MLESDLVCRLENWSVVEKASPIPEERGNFSAGIMVNYSGE